MVKEFGIQAKMAKSKMIKEFLQENNVTSNDMSAMWAYMYDKNWIIKNLTNSGKSWNNLNPSAMKSLIEQYNKQTLPENFDLLEWYEGYLVAKKLGGN